MMEYWEQIGASFAEGSESDDMPGPTRPLEEHGPELSDVDSLKVRAHETC